MAATFPPKEAAPAPPAGGAAPRGGPGAARGAPPGAAARGPPKPAGEVEIKKVVQMIKNQRLDPAVVFSFSRRDCERYAAKLMKAGDGRGEAAAVDFNSPEEKASIEAVFRAALAVLSEEDRAMPFAEAMLPMLQRGIGVHHSGLLPILKEVVEVLFQEGLVKVRARAPVLHFLLRHPLHSRSRERGRLAFDRAALR
jgi:ATP-dependent RNA helicase DOB1